ncbi:MAG TPA: hypothetical protein VMU59_10690 [Caulobacteraceae bacterium]|nr:hypothetical protein [Caulobacteraceae bacterium]
MPVTGTHPDSGVFDGDKAAKGYPLNRLCFSLNEQKNRELFLNNEDLYCDTFALSDAQKAAVRARDVLGLLEAGGNIYYLAKMAGAWGLNVQDVGALQTGVSVEAFKAFLLSQAES